MKGAATVTADRRRLMTYPRDAEIGLHVAQQPHQVRTAARPARVDADVHVRRARDQTGEGPRVAAQAAGNGAEVELVARAAVAVPPAVVGDRHVGHDGAADRGVAALGEELATNEAPRAVGADRRAASSSCARSS